MADRLEQVLDEIYGKANALRAEEPTLTLERALERVRNADPVLRRRYETALLLAGGTIVSGTTDSSDETQIFGPCTRCGLPITWHNGLFLCGDCLAGHFAMPNLAVWKVPGEIFSARWAGYTFAALGSYIEEKRDEGDVSIFKPALAQAIWYFNDGFFYAEIRRHSTERPAESIQLVNIAQTDRKEALRLATRGFGLLDFTESERGRPFLTAKAEADQRAKMRQIMARYKKYPSAGMEAAALIHDVPLSTLNRWRKKYGD